MHAPFSGRTPLADTVDKCVERCDVLAPLRRCGRQHLGNRRDSLWPRQPVQGNVPQHLEPQEPGGRLRFQLAKRESELVGHVADHLTSLHASPQPHAVWLESIDPIVDR